MNLALAAVTADIPSTEPPPAKLPGTKVGGTASFAQALAAAKRRKEDVDVMYDPADGSYYVCLAGSVEHWRSHHNWVSVTQLRITHTITGRQK